MGLGFASISALQTTPFWEALYNVNDLAEPLFSFYLESYVNQANQISAAPGGVLLLEEQIQVCTTALSST
jgi:cathepsin D